MQYTNSPRSIFLTLARVCFVLLFPHFIPTPFFSYSIVCLALVYYFLRWQHKNFKDLGLVKISARAAITGILSAVILVAIMNWVFYPLLDLFFGKHSGDYSDYDFIRGNPVNFMVILVASWLVGGFYEELIFRGFIFKETKALLAGSRSNWLLACILTTLLFALYHAQQGVFGMAHAAMTGLFWNLLLKYSKGNLWYSVFSHAAYDTIGLTMIFTGYISH
jgi:membrane protease YdiL (CAAX protease family)